MECVLTLTAQLAKLSILLQLAEIKEPLKTNVDESGVDGKTAIPQFLPEGRKKFGETSD